MSLYSLILSQAKYITFFMNSNSLLWTWLENVLCIRSSQNGSIKHSSLFFHQIRYTESSPFIAYFV